MTAAVLGRIMDHVRLVKRMAKATGADLVAAYEAGDLTQQEWTRMVQRCRACDWTEDCGAWLETHHAVACAPKTCPNRARFKELKAGAALRTAGGKQDGRRISKR